jgi:hypothetical protein
MGDDVVIDRLANSSADVPRALGRRLRSRHLPRGIYRGELLHETDRNETEYRSQQEWLRRLDLLSPSGRARTETELARRARLEPWQVLIYCPPAAPGFRQVEHWVSEKNDGSNVTRQSPSVSSEIARRHLGLWELWVFAMEVRAEKQRLELANAAQDRFGMQNFIEIDRLQGRLF